MVDPFSSITSALSKSGKYTLNTFQINFTPVKDFFWKTDSEKIIKIITSKSPDFIKKILLSKYLIFLKVLAFPFVLFAKIIKLFLKRDEEGSSEQTEEKSDEIAEYFKTKLSLSGYNTSINIIHA